MAGVQPEDGFAELVQQFAGRPGVGVPDPTGRRTFGSSALKINGSIFAMLSEGRLVVKLPAERVAELIRDGTGEPFDGGKTRPMKEWLAVSGLDPEVWSALSHEASEFVSSRKG